ncbi:MAG: ferrochelatase, partial [Pseudomonadota bacterium]
MLDSKSAETVPAASLKTSHTASHLPGDHPAVKPGKIGVLLANLGTPDNYDYWSMRRYLNEFLSDRRVIDYSPWIWQPLLQLVILTKRPFSSGDGHKRAFPRLVVPDRLVGLTAGKWSFRQ